MGIFNKKLGDEVTKKELGIFDDLFTGKIRMLKITYTVQDEDGVTMDMKLLHKDYYDSDDEDDSEVTKGVKDGNE